MILWKKGHASLDLLEKWVGSVLKSTLCNKGMGQNNETFGKKDVHSLWKKVLM